MAREARIAMLRGELDKAPDDIFFNYALGLEFSGSGIFHDAIVQFERVLALDSRYVPAYYQLGKMHEATGNAQEALHYFSKGLEIARSKGDRKSAGEFEEAIFMIGD